MNKTLSVIASAIVGAGAVVAVATVAAPAANAADGDLATGTYSIPYSSALFSWDEPSETLDQLTYDEWQAAGFPTPTSTVSSSFYAKYPWSAGIVGVTFFTAPTSANPIYYYEGLTGASWARAGNPQPDVVSDAVLPGSGVLQYRSSSEIFVFDASEVFHKLSYGEWTGLGSPAPASVGAVQKYSFNSTLYLYVDPTDETPGSVIALDGAAWNRLANPTPATTSNNRLPGDAVFAFTDDPGTIFLRTPTKQTWYLTYAQWVSMGQPTPAPVTPPATNAPAAASKAVPTAGRLKTDTPTHRKAVQVLRTAVGLR